MYLRRKVVHEVPRRQQVLGAQAPPADAAAVASAGDALVKEASVTDRPQLMLAPTPRPRHA